MPTRRYDITTDARMTRATVSVWEKSASQSSSTALARQIIHSPTKHTTINGIARLILNDYLSAVAPPDGGTLPAVSTAQTKAVTRLIARRLTGQSQTSVSSTEIASKLLAPFLASGPDQWIRRYSVPSSKRERTWTVAQAKNGEWGCSCPQWRFRRRQCTHIEAVQQNPNWYPYTPASAQQI